MTDPRRDVRSTSLPNDESRDGRIYVFLCADPRAKARDGLPISLTYVEVTTLAREDLGAILDAFPETAHAVAHAAVFYKVRAAFLRWAARRRAEAASAAAAAGAEPELAPRKSSLMSVALDVRRSALHQRRHSGVYRKCPSSSGRGVLQAAKDPRLNRSTDEAPPRQPPLRQRHAERSGGGRRTFSFDESSYCGSSDSTNPALTPTDRRLDELQGQLGVLDAMCGARFSAIEAVLTRLDRRLCRKSYTDPH